MEVTPGYKQTEVGVIPKEWDVVPLGTLLQFKNGLNKAKEYFGFGTPIVNYMDVFQHSCLRLGDVLGRVDVNTRELRAYEVRQGDVFFTRTSETVEEIGVASVMLDELEDTVFSGFVLRARPTDQSLDDQFKGYCFTPRYFRQQVTARASYTTRALTNGRSLSAALLVRPPLREQGAIATALSDADDLIEALEQLVIKKRHIKQGAMQELLTGKRRLPGFSGDWDVRPLGEVSTLQRGFDLPYRLRRPGTVPIVTSSGVEDTHCEAKVSAPGVVTGRYGTIGKVFFIREDFWPLNTTLYVRDFHGNYPLFISYLLRTIDFHTHSGKSGVPGVNRNDLHEIIVPLPPTRAEQEAIATILSDMDAGMAALETKLTKMRQIKQGMMHNLLTGRIRLI